MPWVQIASLDLLARVDEVAAVQSAALGPVPPDRAQVFARHVAHPGFRAFGAFDDGALVGFSYGALCRPGQWWYDQIRPALAMTGHRRWLADPYAVTELHVLPSHHGHGLGLRLLHALLADVGTGSALLSTYDAESRARRLYRGLGFVDLLTGFRFGGQLQPYAVMAAPLPLKVSVGTAQECAAPHARSGVPPTL
ncbi:MAG: GNAT family N-acetyltransferase [Sporichthyaceae bacterium]